MVNKTVAGFMNAEGGSLLISVTDTGEVSGIETDLKSLGDRCCAICHRQAVKIQQIRLVHSSYPERHEEPVVQ